MIEENAQKPSEAFLRLLSVMDELRQKCPWDKKQTTDSLRNLTIEETYELSEAIIAKNSENICEELGDIIMHIVFYALIASEEKKFDITDVLNGVCNKLIYRHPHVFSTTKADTPEEVKANWEKLKLKEKPNKTVLSGVPSSLPAMIKAFRIQDKARAAGFDWDEPKQVWAKVHEEVDELQTEFSANNKEKSTAEFGDLMFSMINAARLYDIDPEQALELTNQKFIRRFNFLEQETIKKGKPLSSLSLDEMNEIWNQAKSAENE